MTKPTGVTDKEWKMAEAFWEETHKEVDPYAILITRLARRHFPDKQGQIKFHGYLKTLYKESKKRKHRRFTPSEMLELATRWEVEEAVREDLKMTLFGPEI